MQRTHEGLRRGGLVGPLLLIGLGVIFLLNNVGVLDWSVWQGLLRLWPVLLIAVGLDLLLGRRLPWAAPIIALAVLALIGVLLWRVDMQQGGAITNAPITQPLDGATRADVEIAAGIGTLRIGALDGGANLIEGTIDRARGERVLQDYDVRYGTGYVTLRSQGTRFGLPWWGDSGDHLWSIMLNPNVPTALRLNTGVGIANVDLSRLQITKLDLNTGVGEATLTLPAQGQGRADVNGGVGATTIIIPEGMAVRIDATTGLGDLDVPDDYRRSGDVYTSPNYDTATDRMELQVKGGIGDITIEHAE